MLHAYLIKLQGCKAATSMQQARTEVQSGSPQSQIAMIWFATEWWTLTVQLDATRATFLLQMA